MGIDPGPIKFVEPSAPNGALIAKVMKGGPADQGVLKTGGVLLE
jgi:S1-C subfamily serine protease